jgi:hypothetical protein
MRRTCLFLVALLGACGRTSEAELPLSSGEYVFTHRFAEHPDIPSIELTVRIRGRHVTVTNDAEAAVFPRGLIEEGTLMWHSRSGQWIIGAEPADAEAPVVGGCSDGPSVIDLRRKVYWTC